MKGRLYGYFLQIGETGATDGFHLYKQTGIANSRIITGPKKTRPKAGTVYAKVKVTRDALGKWELFTDIAGGNKFNLEGGVNDATFSTSTFAGVYCKYVVEFVIKDLVPDTTPPTLQSIAVINATTLDVNFSESPDSNTTLMRKLLKNQTIARKRTLTWEVWMIMERKLQLVFMWYSLMCLIYREIQSDSKVLVCLPES